MRELSIRYKLEKLQALLREREKQLPWIIRNSQSISFWLAGAALVLAALSFAGVAGKILICYLFK